MARPRCLLMDEASTGLDPTIVAEMVDTILGLNRRGMTILLVERYIGVAALSPSRRTFYETAKSSLPPGASTIPSRSAPSLALKVRQLHRGRDRSAASSS